MLASSVRTKAAVVITAGLMVLAVAACGGGSSSSAPSIVARDDSTTSTTKASSSTTESKSTTTDNRGGGGPGALGAFGGDAGKCFEFALAYGTLSLGALGSTFGSSQQGTDELNQELEKLQAEVPAEIKSDFDVVRKGFATFNEKLQGASGNILDPAYQRSLEEAGKALDSPEFTAAQKNIENYLDKACPS